MKGKVAQNDIKNGKREKRYNMFVVFLNFNWQWNNMLRTIIIPYPQKKYTQSNEIEPNLI